MNQTLYRQSHWNGEDWVHVHVYSTNTGKKLSIHGLEASINTSAFLSMCTQGDQTYMYDYGADNLYVCSVCDPRTSEVSFSRNMRAIKLARYILVRQLQARLFTNRQHEVGRDDGAFADTVKPPTPLFKLMRNVDTLRPYTHLRSRQQRRHFGSEAIVSASICATDASTVMAFIVERRIVHGTPADMPVYENYLLKTSVSSGISERIKLQSDFNRINSIIYHSNSIFVTVEHSITKEKTAEDLNEEEKYAEKLVKIKKRLAAMDPEGEDYKELEPYYRSAIAPFVQKYAVCRLDLATCAVETIIETDFFIKLFASDIENDTILIVASTYDLSNTLLVSSYNTVTRKLTHLHPKTDPDFILDKTTLEASYLKGGVLMNPVSQVEIIIAPDKISVRPSSSSAAADVAAVAVAHEVL